MKDVNIFFPIYLFASTSIAPKHPHKHAKRNSRGIKKQEMRERWRKCMGKADYQV